MLSDMGKEMSIDRNDPESIAQLFVAKSSSEIAWLLAETVGELCCSMGYEPLPMAREILKRVEAAELDVE